MDVLAVGSRSLSQRGIHYAMRGEQFSHLSYRGAQEVIVCGPGAASTNSSWSPADGIDAFHFEEYHVAIAKQLHKLKQWRTVGLATRNELLTEVLRVSRASSSSI